MITRMLFGVVDYVIFGLTLLLSMLIGIYFRFTGGKQKTTEEFFLGNKEESVIPVAFSMMANFFSAISILGVTSETYLYGFHIAIHTVPFIFVTPIIIYVYHSVFYNLEVTTVNEYLNRRFGKYARGSASVAFMIQIILYMAVVLYAPSLTLNAVAGIPLWASILSVGIVCTFYCTIGGIKAVIWTDFFQLLLMFASIIAVMIKGCIDVGGFGNMWKIASDGGRISKPSFAFDLNDRYGFWALTIGGFFYYLSVNCINQTQVQRMMTLGTLNKSRKAIYVTQILVVAFALCLCLCGIIIYANMGSCDPLLRPSETGLTASDQLFPYYIMQSLGKYPGLPGLCVSGIFSASFSTISAGVNSLAAVTLEDFIKPYCCVGSLTESRAAFITKILVLTYGVICILLSYLVGQLSVLIQVSITVLSVLGGPVFGLFTLGMLFIRPNEKGAVVGLVVSSILFLWIGIGNNLSKFYTKRLPQTIEGCSNVTSIFANVTTNDTITEKGYVFPLYKVSYMWFSVFGTLLTIALGYFVSIITGPNATVHEELLSPVACWMYGYSSYKEEDEEDDSIKFRHKDSDLVRAGRKDKVSHAPGVLNDVSFIHEVRKNDFEQAAYL